MHYISERAIVEETCIKSVNFIEPENSELMDQLFLFISIYFAECPLSSTLTFSLSFNPA